MLYSNECVILPGFGGFITQFKESELVKTANVVYPARESVAFNERLKDNDGLLASHISKSEGISFAEAGSYIAREVSELRNRLESEGNCSLAPLGTLYLTKEGQLLFVPDLSVNFLKASYGLPNLRIRPLSTAKETPVEEVNPVLRSTPVKKDNRLEKQEQIRESRTERPKVLKIMNVLGTIFLLAMMSAILNVELGQGPTATFDQYAQLLDTQTTQDRVGSFKEVIESLLNEYEQNSQLSRYSILLDGTFSRTEVENIQLDLSKKFSQSEIIELENNGYTISVISFVNPELAKEYRDLIQKTIGYELIITAK